MGSPDLTAARLDAALPSGLAAGRRPGFSVNALSAPGGPPLLTLAGGDADLERGEVVARSLLLSLAVAQGLPVLNGSVLARAGLRRFAASVLQLRRKYRHLLAPPLLDSPRDITWHNASGNWEPDWSGEGAASGAAGANFISFSVRGNPPGYAPPAHQAPPSMGSDSDGEGSGAPTVAPTQAVYVGFNPNPEPVTAFLPSPPAGMQWRRLIDTSRLPPDDVVLEGGELLQGDYIIAPGAALMLDAVARPPVTAFTSAEARAKAAYGQAP
jgi:isoamylase